MTTAPFVVGFEGILFEIGLYIYFFYFKDWGWGSDYLIDGEEEGFVA